MGPSGATWRPDRQDDDDDGSFLHLRWNSHLESVQQVFETLLRQQMFVDVTLSCSSGGSLRAHRLMLSACSPYLRRLLRDPSVAGAKHPVIVLPPQVTYHQMEHIVQFVYRGEVSVPEVHLPALLRTAR